jgi:hypothetical protein
MMCPGIRAHHASSHGWSPVAVGMLYDGLLERPLFAEDRRRGGELEKTLSEDEKKDNYGNEIR